ncbi:helix-turn-helix domain-containing protein [Rhodanobacter lindaniclasticus]
MNAARLPAIEAAVSTSSQAALAHGSSSALSECVGRTVRRYLADIGDTQKYSEGLHALVLREVEVPLLREVLAFHGGNQSHARWRWASIAPRCARSWLRTRLS